MHTARPTEEEVSQLHGGMILNTTFHNVHSEKREGPNLTEKETKKREQRPEKDKDRRK